MSDGAAFVDGVLATMDNQQSEATPSASGGKAMSEAQKLHILKVRKFVETTSNFAACDWRNILFRSTEWSTPNKYYVKASAAWVPHLLKKGFHPYCPTCNTPVPNIDYRWVDQPTIMFGINNYRFLDTVRYNCACCRKSFRATNPKSLSLDKTGFVSSTFQVHLLKRCAVDQELYGYITSSIMLPTSVIVASLKEQSMKAFAECINQYYQVLLEKKAAGDGTIRMSQNNGSQSIVNAFARCRAVNGARTLNRALETKQGELRDAKLGLNRERQIQESTIPLKSLKGIGIGKIKLLTSIGVKCGQDLVLVYEQRLAGDPRRFNEVCGVFQKREAVKIVERYVKMVQLKLRSREEKLRAIEDKVESLESEITRMGEESAAVERNLHRNGTQHATVRVTRRPFQIQKFSTFHDRNGYNGRFFSEYYVDHVLNSYFQQQKPGMKTRMCNLGGEILSLDFQYKAAHRVKVYVNGKPFSPWKAMASILNEHAMAVWWGFLKGSESLSEIEPHLKALKKRLDRVQGPEKLKVIYVDNCCNVRAKLQGIFGAHVLVCLDIYHWLARWDECVRDKKSPRYPVFKSLMSRAVLQASESDYREKATELRVKLGREPTAKEILKQCRKSTPSPANIEESVRAIIEYFLLEDAKIIAATPVVTGQTTNSTGPSLPPKLFMQQPTVVRDVLRRQLAHVQCVCDPPNVVLYRQNGAGIIFCGRSSSQNERFFREINEKVLRFCSVSVTRAERTIWVCVDGWNQGANVRRLGAEDYHTSNLESLAFANSLAKALGLPDSDIPFPDVSLASMSCQPCQEEEVGFELDAGGFDATMSEMNHELDDDGSAVSEGEQDQNPEAASESAVEEHVSETDAAEIARIEELLGRVRNREILSGRKNSLESFTLMTGENPWLPFLDDRSPRALAERKLFNEMKANFDRHVSPSTPVRGYEAFSSAWCQEVGQRYLARLAGVVSDDTEVEVIYSKTAKQLADFFDKLESESQVAAVLNTAEATQRQREVNQVIRRSRENLPSPAVVPVGPIRYSQTGQTRATPIGAPLVLNTAIALPVGTVTMNPQSVSGAAPFLRHILEPRQSIPSCLLPKGAFRKICQHCGRLRADHQSGFGKTKCTYRNCGRCFQQHLGMGLACKAQPGPSVRPNDLAAYDVKIKMILDRPNSGT